MGKMISELTYEQLKPLVNENSVVVLPIGGGAKEHGGHLPTTHCESRERVAELAASFARQCLGQVGEAPARPTDAAQPGCGLACFDGAG